MKLEVKGNQLLIKGYANVTGKDSREIFTSNTGVFKEQIIRRTFSRALRKADNIDLLFNHNKKRKLGSIKDGNLRLYEDSIGLFVECRIFDQEVIDKAQKGLLTGWSFGMVCKGDFWQKGSDGIQRRYVHEIDLLELSLLDQQPAYEGTSISIEGLEKRATPFDLNKYLLEKEIEILKLKGGVK